MRTRDSVRYLAFSVVCIFISSLAYGESVVGIVAGNGIRGFSGDNGLAIEASLNQPQDVAVYNEEFFIADKENHSIRKVNVDGIITTIVGDGVQNFNGDGGLASEASLSLPYRIDFDSLGNMFIADNGNHRIRKVDSATGIITTVAGNNADPNTFEEGPATDIYINGGCVEVDSFDDIYVCDRNRIMHIDMSTGYASVFFELEAGTSFLDVETDDSGNVYIADYTHKSVHKINLGGEVSTLIDGVLVGSVTALYDEIYYTDVLSGNVNKLNSLGVVTTIISGLNIPLGVDIDDAGNVFVADRNNNKVKQLSVSINEDSDKGHGNNEDGIDKDNPGKGYGRNNNIGK